MQRDYPDSDPPFYFRRRVGFGEFGGLTIYGRKIEPDSAFDKGQVAQAEEFGEIFTLCYSDAEQYGELGMTPKDECEEITLEEFEAAQARGWKD